MVFLELADVVIPEFWRPWPPTEKTLASIGETALIVARRDAAAKGWDCELTLTLLAPDNLIYMWTIAGDVGVGWIRAVGHRCAWRIHWHPDEDRIHLHLFPIDEHAPFLRRYH